MYTRGITSANLIHARETPMRCRYETPIVIRAADTAYICDFLSSRLDWLRLNRGVAHAYLAPYVAMNLISRSVAAVGLKRGQSDVFEEGRATFFLFFTSEKKNIRSRISSEKGIQIATWCSFPSILSVSLKLERSETLERFTLQSFAKQFSFFLFLSLFFSFYTSLFELIIWLYLSLSLYRLYLLPKRGTERIWNFQKFLF